MRWRYAIDDIAGLPKGGWIGVDPGRSSGGLAYLTEEAGWCRKISDLTDAELWQAFEALGRRAPAHAQLERVSAMPGQGVSSTFKFGASFGELRMALTAIRVPLSLVTPSKWQRDLGCLSKGDKNATKARAQQLYPDARLTHATADAVLIAHHTRITRP